jgi:hypothetical protein
VLDDVAADRRASLIRLIDVRTLSMRLNFLNSFNATQV